MPRILLVEDDEIMRITIQDALERNHWTVDAVTNGKEALKKIKVGRYHLVISDIRMPELGGMELLANLTKTAVLPDVIMMTAFGSVDDAITCLKNGAADYILKPFDMDDLIIRVNRIFEIQSVKARCASLEDCCQQNRQTIIGSSEAIARVHQRILQAGPTDSTVLITGESGTGKELAANALHLASLRADKPYIRINCAAIPEGLIEAELFGHEKGAYTGAHKKRLGRFEMADGGTLLLDEIGDMPMPLQSKLLRVLQEGEFERVGGSHTIAINVRILCATAKNLQQEVQQGRFRQDLLYRISVIPLSMPALRERREDIPLLVNHFLKEFSNKRGLLLSLSAEAMHLLVSYDFPGNVRELKNIIERASVLAPGPVITPDDLPTDLGRQIPEEPLTEESVRLSSALAKTEKKCLLGALALTRGNRTKAADLLGISRKNLWEKMKLHHIKM
ncbi:MAG TPA: sigma-54-dependent Fis family transcriptional regulator [Desulfobulbaceae bacterium]|nr:sigma-54-dependent Fis family transcriptional regulator [Desulfobulbaceae bacterium]